MIREITSMLSTGIASGSAILIVVVRREVEGDVVCSWTRHSAQHLIGQIDGSSYESAVPTGDHISLSGARVYRDVRPMHGVVFWKQRGLLSSSDAYEPVVIGKVVLFCLQDGKGHRETKFCSVRQDVRDGRKGRLYQ